MILNNFYEAIMARLTSNIPAIKHFDLYFGQDELQEEETELPFLCPAVLFEYNPMDFESLGNKKQATEAEFRLHVISTVIQEVDKRTAPAIRTLGHSHLQLLDDVFYWMSGFNGDGFNSISRTGIDPYKPNGQNIKHIMRFKTRLTDVAAVRTLTNISATLTTTVEIVP